jgi:hypothetical protein
VRGYLVGWQKEKGACLKLVSVQGFAADAGAFG